MSNPMSDFKDINYKDLLRDYSYADNQYEILCNEIKQFQDNLDDEHEIGLITPYNSSKIFIITDLGFHNPNLIYFYGYYDDHEAQLIQHVNQINILLTAIPKQPNKPLRRVGFITDIN